MGVLYEYRRIDDMKDFFELMKFPFFITQNRWSKIQEQAERFNSDDSRIPYGAYVGDELVAEYQLISMRMRLRDSVVPMGGIRAVCTKPLYRGKGAVKFLLENSLKTMKENGQAVSVLYPFNVGFYKKYGWELFDTMLTIKLSPGIINVPEIKANVEAEEMEIADIEIKDFYNNYSANHNTIVLRDDEMWETDSEYWFEQDISKKIVKFSRDGKITGLIRYILSGSSLFGGKSDFMITMFMTDDKETKKEMLKFLNSLSFQISEITMFVQPDFVILPYLTNRPSGMSIDIRSMIRIVDLQGLNGLKINSPDMSVKIKVRDKQALWNNGVFKLSVENKILKVEETEEPELSCDIGILSAIIGGSTTIKEMLECDMIDELSGYHGQDFPRETPFVMEPF